MEATNAIAPRSPEISRGARYAVVMTACIDPSRAVGKVPVRRADPVVRLTDYTEALRFWLGHRDARIKSLIFLENSGYPLDELKRVAERENYWNRECEFVSLDCNEHREGVNYGYSEFKLLDLGLAQSQAIKEVEYFAKVTGRYRFPTISQLIDALPDTYKIAADTRDNGLFRKYHQRIVTVPLILFDIKYYDSSVRSLYTHMMSYAEDPRKSYIEDILYDTLLPLRNAPGIILRWPRNCDPVGVGGNGNELENPKRRLLAVVRAVGRRLIPNWWF